MKNMIFLSLMVMLFWTENRGSSAFASDCDREALVKRAIISINKLNKVRGAIRNISDDGNRNISVEADGDDGVIEVNVFIAKSVSRNYISYFEVEIDYEKCQVHSLASLGSSSR